MYEDLVPEVGDGLTALERLVACRNRAAYLHDISSDTPGPARIALLSQALNFELRALRAEVEARSSA